MLIKVKVFPASKKNEVILKAEDSFEVKVKSKAEAGKANQELILSLINYFKKPKEAFRVVKGLRSRSKIIEILEK